MKRILTTSSIIIAVIWLNLYKMASNISCSGVTEDLQKQLLIACGIISGLSLIACVLTLILMECLCCFGYIKCIFSKKGLPSHRLVFYITISAIIRAMVTLLQTIAAKDEGQHKYWCMAVGFLNQYSAWVVLLFSLMATIHVLLFSLDKSYPKLEFCYFLAPFIVPLTFSWIPFIHDAYGLAGAWCWIRKEDKDCTEYLAGLIEQYILWYVPHFILVVINTVLIIIIFVLMQKVFKQKGKKEFKTCNWFLQVLPMLLFTIVYLSLNWLGTINHIYQTIYPVENIHVWMFHAVSSSSWGLVTGISFTIYLIILCYIARQHDKSNEKRIREAIEMYRGMTRMTTDTHTS